MLTVDTPLGAHVPSSPSHWLLLIPETPHTTWKELTSTQWPATHEDLFPTSCRASWGDLVHKVSTGSSRSISVTKQSPGSFALFFNISLQARRTLSTVIATVVPESSPLVMVLQLLHPLFSVFTGTPSDPEFLDNKSLHNFTFLRKEPILASNYRLAFLVFPEFFHQNRIPTFCHSGAICLFSAGTWNLFLFLVAVVVALTAAASASLSFRNSSP